MFPLQLIAGEEEEEEEEWGRRRTCWGRHTLLEASALRTESTPLWRGGAYSQVRLRSMALCCLEPRYAFHSYDLYIYVCVCVCVSRNQIKNGK